MMPITKLLMGTIAVSALSVACSREPEDVSPRTLIGALEKNGVMGMLHEMEVPGGGFPLLMSGEYLKGKDAREETAKFTGVAYQAIKDEFERLWGDLSERDFALSVKAMCDLSETVGSRDGYNNLVMATLVRWAIIEVMTRKVVLNQNASEDLWGIVNRLKNTPIRSSRLYNVVKSERGEGFEIKESDLAGKSEYDAYAYLYDYFCLHDAKKARKSMKGEIAFEVDTGGKHNLENTDVRGFIGMHFMEQFALEYLLGIFEVVRQATRLPTDKDKFCEIADSHISVVKNKIICEFTKKPYESAQFWSMREMVRNNPSMSMPFRSEFQVH